MKSGGVRLTAGALGGRRIAVPEGVRPTGGRVREALFSIWAEAIDGARFLDLFAGSGAVALEAVSRGADEAVLVEGRRAITRALARTLRTLPPLPVSLLELELPGGLADPRLVDGGPFDRVFADPPYRFDAFDSLLRGIEPLLAPAGEAAIEHAAAVELPAEGGGLVRVGDRRYGDSRLAFYRRAADGPQPPAARTRNASSSR